VTLSTANDHIKAISAKTGADSRGDLMATVFRCHSMPGLVAGDPAKSPHSALAQSHHGSTSDPGTP
jgi:hypothetical protein